MSISIDDHLNQVKSILQELNYTVSKCCRAPDNTEIYLDLAGENELTIGIFEDCIVVGTTVDGVSHYHEATWDWVTDLKQFIQTELNV